MSQATQPRWRSMQTDETRRVEAVLRTTFPRSDAYRFNSASIRVRVIDATFEGKSNEEREAMVEPLLEQLPESTQADIMNLATYTPAEIASAPPPLWNIEFEDPSPSML
ncbi:MAG: hypothetical protein M3552_01795 [Planctomycetota bacterium]|nr:hypothetical protein [Planctomycetaceae bacterium]MDQ3329380.1 hypothetical protein [Planctomycetota bacterium]